MREAASGIRDTKEAGKRKKRYETAKRNLDSDVCGDNAGDADGAVCEGARPAGKDDPRSAGNYGGLRPFPEEGKEILAALQTAGLAYEAEYRVLL